jgi:hypothetical protein
MSKEKYNQVIDETYLNYRNAFVEGHVHQELDKCLSQEEFVQQIKTDDEFAKIWGIKQTVVQLIIQALDIECKSRGMNVNWDMYLEMEKERIETAYNKGTVHGIDYPESTLPLTGEQYYNETYGGGNK